MDRFLRQPIGSPSDVSKMFMGQRKNLVNALRNLFSFLEVKGYDSFYLTLMRKSLLRCLLG
ncbi:MAG: hypothetical protein QXU02_06555 [Candidatus Bathyarchaeia archaeon]